MCTFEYSVAPGHRYGCIHQITNCVHCGTKIVLDNFDRTGTPQVGPAEYTCSAVCEHSYVDANSAEPFLQAAE